MSLSLKQVARPRARRASQVLFEAVESRVLMTATLARASDSFVDTIGVNTAWSFPVYASNAAAISTKLGNLGVRWLRGGLYPDNTAARDRYLAFYNTYGIKTTDSIQEKTGGILDQSKIAARVAALAPYADKLIAIEGPNEYNGSGDPNWAPNLRAFQQNMYGQVKANTALQNLPVIGPSMSQTPAYATLGNITAYTDKGNIHSYPGANEPSAGLGGWIGAQSTAFGSDPVWATETGYHNAINTTTGVSEAAVAKYVPRLFLSYFDAGVERTAEYSLVDAAPDPGKTNDQNNYGLLRNDISEKPAYVALKNLIDLTEDPGASFTPGSLDFGVAGGGVSDIKRVLLQKRDGTFQLALWREIKSWDPATKTDITNTPSAVTISLNQPISSAVVYVPGTSATVTPVSTIANPTTLSLNITDEVTIINLTPAAPAQTVGGWNFDGASGLTSSDTASGSTASAITKGARFNSSNDGGVVQNLGTGADTPSNALSVTGAFLVEGANPNLAVSTGSYYQFSITPGASPLNLTSLQWKANPVNDTSGMSFVVRSSLDGYASNIGTQSTVTGAGWLPLTVDLSGASFQNLTSAVTFRMYVWEPTGSSGWNSIDSIKLNAGSTVVAPPTVATYSFDNSAARTTATTTATNSTASNLTYGPRFATNATTYDNNANSRDALGIFGNFTLNTEANAVSTGSYIELTLTAAAGHTLDLTDFSFYAKAPSTNSASFALRSNLSSYGTDIGPALTATTSGAYQKLTFDLSAAAYNGLSTITFRLYVWDTTTVQSDYTRIDTIAVGGTVV